MARIILQNANVLDGNNPAVRGHTVVIEAGNITAVTPRSPEAQTDDTVVDLAGKTVMPGMCICHFHSTLKDVGKGPFGSEHPPAYQALLCEKNLREALRWGYTSVVASGASNDVEPGVKQAIEDGLIVGPRLVPSGREIGTTGHAQDSAPWYWHVQQLGAVRVCDGAEGFRLAVRDEIRRGVEVIKLFVTGGHFVPAPGSRIEMTRDEMAAAIDAAHSRNVLIRGHIVSKPSIMMAIELGIDIIDHCDEMDDEVIAALAEAGTFVVPTIYVPKVAAARLEQSQPAAAKTLRDMLAHQYNVLPKAESAGVRMLLGDDYFQHGQYGGELRTYVEDAGISPLALLRWATRYGAELMGRQAVQGTVEAGKVADLLIVDGDPSTDIGVLADTPPLAVLKGGQVVAGSLDFRA